MTGGELFYIMLVNMSGEPDGKGDMRDDCSGGCLSVTEYMGAMK